jgi:hypothetical protein
MGQTMGSLGNQNVIDPNQAKFGDLDSSEKTARIGGAAAKGLGQGMQNYQQQNSMMRNRGGGAGGGGAMSPDPQAPQFSTGNLPGGGTDAWGGALGQRNSKFYGQ